MCLCMSLCTYGSLPCVSLCLRVHELFVGATAEATNSLRARIHTYTRIHVCMQSYTHRGCSWARPPMPMSTSRAHIHIYIHSYACMHSQSHVCVYTHTYTHTQGLFVGTTTDANVLIKKLQAAPGQGWQSTRDCVWMGCIVCVWGGGDCVVCV